MESERTPTPDTARAAPTSRVARYVTFVGYPRSGHSLVGSLLDAHPNMIIAHELDVLELLARGDERAAIWDAILENSRAYAEGGRKWEQYAYAVPGQWNGRFAELRVLGDKKGGRTTLGLAERPALLDTLRDTMKVRCQFVHVVRNPYDNISTMAQRSGVGLSAAIDDYFRRREFVTAIRARVPRADWHDLSHEALVADAAGELRALCGFLGESCDEQYLTDCASIVFATPHRTRSEAAWTSDLVRRVRERMAGDPVLGGYAFGD